MEATPSELQAFAAALSAETADIERSSLAKLVAAKSGETVSESAISQWVTCKNEPSRRKVFALEETLGLAPGSLSRHLGYLPLDAVPASSPEDALRQDTSLPRMVRVSLAAAVEAARRG